MRKINLYDESLYTFIKNSLFWVLNQWDDLSWGAFSFLDLLLGFLMVSAFIPVVLNLRNVDNTVMSIHNEGKYISSYKEYRSGGYRGTVSRKNANFFKWRRTRGK